jgi:spermidine/putrescine transport system substrate-binding protein
MYKKAVVLAAALAIVAASCGGGGDEAVSAADCAVDQVDGDLNFYNWSDYIDESLVTTFEEQYDVGVNSTTYESNEAMLSQIQEGVSYDLIVPSDYMVKIMIQEGLLVELNKDAIPNFVNMDPQFTSQPYDDGAKYSAAYQYGTTGLGVNTALVGEDFPHSWALIFDPELTANFPGGVSVLNDPRETMGAALEYLGYSLNDTEITHLDEATALIKAAKANIATFDSDEYETNLANGEVSVSHGYSGNMITGIGDSGHPEDFVYILPEEGATLWIDNMAIPTNAVSVCTAHTFINFLLDAENGATLTNYNYYGSPNAAAAPYIEPEVVDFYSETATANVSVIQDQGDYEINYTDKFAEAKS